MAKLKNTDSNSATYAPIYINNYPCGLIHTRQSSRPNLFNSVSFKINNAWASFTLPLNRAHQSTRRSGTEINGCTNLYLGKADATRKVSIRKDDGYSYIDMTNKQILDAIQSDRANYKSALA